jgi:LysR family hydrogen peroxide-inducible transcriptional activator
MRPSIQQLESFLAVARTGSFRRAAEENFVSQSALSAQIKRLEEILGVTLFERDRRRTLLTHEGERAREMAVAVLEAVDKLVDAVEPKSDPLASDIRLGVIPTAAAAMLPQILRAVRRASPEARLLVYEEPTAKLVQRLQSGELDVVLLDVDVELGNLASRVLFEEALVLAVGAKHEFADRETVSLAEVSDIELLLLEDGHCLSDRVRSFCHPHETSEFGDFRATSLVTLAYIVASGIGATLLPELSAHEFASVPGLKLIPFEQPAPARRMGLAWRQTDTRTAMIDRLGEVIDGACDVA